MKQDQVRVGMLVAANDLPDGQVYRVEEQRKNIVRLEYFVPEYGWLNGGFIDVCYLRTPTRQQLETAGDWVRWPEYRRQWKND